jgi:hypothetical protein
MRGLPDDYYYEMVALRAFEKYGIGRYDNATTGRAMAQKQRRLLGLQRTGSTAAQARNPDTDTGRAGHRATVNTFNSTTYKGQSVVIWLYNLIPVPKYEADNSYRKNLTI